MSAPVNGDTHSRHSTLDTVTDAITSAYGDSDALAYTDEPAEDHRHVVQHEGTP